MKAIGIDKTVMIENATEVKKIEVTGQGHLSGQKYKKRTEKWSKMTQAMRMTKKTELQKGAMKRKSKIWMKMKKL